jgi:hypothetical protein
MQIHMSAAGSLILFSLLAYSFSGYGSGAPGHRSTPTGDRSSNGWGFRAAEMPVTRSILLSARPRRWTWREFEARGNVVTGWAVEQLEIDSDDFLLFRGAAYGRYFALMPEGKIQRSRFAQVDYEEPEQSNLLWLATSLKGSKEVNLRSGNGDTGLDVRWTVEAVPMSTTPSLLPAPVAVSLAVPSNSNFWIFVLEAQALDVYLFVSVFSRTAKCDYCFSPILGSILCQESNFYRSKFFLTSHFISVVQTLTADP